MRNLKANNDLGTHQRRLRGDIFSDIDKFFRYTDTIYTQPTGYRNLTDTLLCWEWMQLDWRQQWSGASKFYIGNNVDMSEYQPDQYYTEGNKRFVYTCRSYGSSL